MNLTNPLEILMKLVVNSLKERKKDKIISLKFNKSTTADENNITPFTFYGSGVSTA